MIKKVTEHEIAQCVEIIKESFITVADKFGFTAENAPRFTAFATTADRLKWHLFEECRTMYAFYDNDNIVGYYSLRPRPTEKFNIVTLIDDLNNENKKIGFLKYCDWILTSIFNRQYVS